MSYYLAVAGLLHPVFYGGLEGLNYLLLLLRLLFSLFRLLP